jgi:predicted nucleotidyltransferase
MPAAAPLEDPDGAAAATARRADAQSPVELTDTAWDDFLSDATARRRDEQERLISLARSYVHDLSQEIDVAAAVVVGPVAGGDFETGSDVDVIIVSDDLPARALGREAMLGASAPRGLQAVGFRQAELRYAVRRGNPIVRGIAELGIVLVGGDLVRSLLPESPPTTRRDPA